MKSRAKTARKWILFWTLFIGIGALGGTAMMLFDPAGETTGMAGLIPFFQVLPLADRLFQNLIFSGIALLIVNGLTNLTAAALIFRKKRSGLFLGGLFGITLMLWIVIQFIIFPPNFMSTAYFFFGFSRRLRDFRPGFLTGRRPFPFPPPIIRTSGRVRSGWLCFSRGWDIPERSPWKRPTARAPRCMRSKHPKKPTARSAFSGAGASGCTAGPCPSSRSPKIFPPTGTSPFARPSGFSPFARPCAPSAGPPAAKFRRPI